MELNTKGRYAVTAMAELAQAADGAALALSSIADRQVISLAYLEQIFLKLRRAGLVESARGRTGGYRLARPARDIQIAEIMTAVEEDMRMTRCGADAATCLPGRRCITHGLWNALSDHIEGFLAHGNAAAGDRWHAGRCPARPSDAPASRGGRRMNTNPRAYLDWNATAPLTSRSA